MFFSEEKRKIEKVKFQINNQIKKYIYITEKYLTKKIWMVFWLASMQNGKICSIKLCTWTFFSLPVQNIVDIGWYTYLHTNFWKCSKKIGKGIPITYEKKVIKPTKKHKINKNQRIGKHTYKHYIWNTLPLYKTVFTVYSFGNCCTSCLYSTSFSEFFYFFLFFLVKNNVYSKTFLYVSSYVYGRFFMSMYIMWQMEVRYFPIFAYFKTYKHTPHYIICTYIILSQHRAHNSKICASRTLQTMAKRFSVLCSVLRTTKKWTLYFWPSSTTCALTTPTSFSILPRKSMRAKKFVKKKKMMKKSSRILEKCYVHWHYKNVCCIRHRTQYIPLPSVLCMYILYCIKHTL